MRVLWAAQYGAPWSAQAAYRRMQRLAALLGFRSPSSHTAYEFSQSLSTLIPEARTEVELVARAYVRHRYGRAGLQSTEEAGACACLEPHQVGGPVPAEVGFRLDFG